MAAARREQLDRAVLAAYAAVDPGGQWDEDWVPVWMETGAGQALPKDHPLIDRRAEVEQKVLANLLRLNHDRSGQLRRTSVAEARSARPSKKSRERFSSLRSLPT